MIHRLTQTRIEKYWAKEFGCSIDSLLTPGSKVFVRSDENGAMVFRYHECCIWHVPERFAAAVRRSVQSHDGIDAVFNREFIAGLFGPAAQVIFGPCPLAYCDDSVLRRDERLRPCRKLTGGDAAAVQRLAAACGPEMWNQGGVEFDVHPVAFGCFADGQLVSAASYEIWGNVIAHVCVVTAPAHRGHGFARSVATAATLDALDQGLVPQWRTEASNVSALGVGQAIGYAWFATHFFARFADRPPPAR